MRLPENPVFADAASQGALHGWTHRRLSLHARSDVRGTRKEWNHGEGAPAPLFSLPFLCALFHSVPFRVGPESGDLASLAS